MLHLLDNHACKLLLTKPSIRPFFASEVQKPSVKILRANGFLICRVDSVEPCAHITSTVLKLYCLTFPQGQLSLYLESSADLALA